ncbi:MAG: pyridoxal phosphate-dependent aminotransferase [Firmicutes bacterium]|nr:pyridoxal phosphate-dependent aminotransferase [Bacillota bacterium]
MFSNRATAITASSTMVLDTRVKQLAADGKNVVSFAAGETDFDTPEHIRAAAIKAINEGFTRYTAASGIPRLKEAVCAKLLRDNGLEYRPNQIVVSNGSKHSLDNIFTALLNEGDEVLIPAPYWVSYPEMVKLRGGKPVIINTNRAAGFKMTPSDLKEAVTSRTRALVLNIPSNPTGQVYNRNELEDIAEIAVEKNICVLSDEVYEKFIYSGEHVSIASLGNEIKDLTIVVNGVSKTYAMTGWRIGYTASTPELALIMSNIQSHAASNPNSIAQMAACAALEQSQECVKEMWKAFEARRNYMVQRFNNMSSLSYLMPEGAFYLFVDISKTFKLRYEGVLIENDGNFANLLLENELVAVVPGEGFGAPGYVRLSYAASMENIREGLDRIEHFLNKLEV